MTFEERVRLLNNTYKTFKRAGVIKTWTEFAEILPTNRQVLSAAKNGNEKYLTDNLMEKCLDALESLEKRESEEQPAIPHSHSHGDSHLVPVIPYKLYNETGVDILKYISDPESSDVQRSKAIAQFASTSCYYFVNTSAMQPHFFPSDLLALKEVNKNAPIVNGESYLINTYDLGIILRFVYDRGDELELRSNTDRYESFLIKKESIVNIFRVIGLIRTNI